MIGGLTSRCVSQVAGSDLILDGAALRVYRIMSLSIPIGVERFASSSSDHHRGPNGLSGDYAPSLNDCGKTIPRGFKP